MNTVASKDCPIPAVLVFASASMLLLVGCGIGSGVQPQAVQGAAISGQVHGGEQPVQKSHIAIFATTSAAPAGTSKASSVYGGSLTPLATTTSDANGGFSFNGIPYTCPAGQQAYLVAAGGNPGLVSGTDNSAIFLVAALGPCSGIAAIPFIDIDEVTTVAAAYALSGFAPAGGVGMTEAAVAAGTAMPGITTSSTNTQGLSDAFANAANIVNVSSGTAYTATPGGNGVVPQNVIYALANILQSCVNGSTPSGGQCPALFSNATPPVGAPVTTAPVNVFQAALDIAQYPGNNVAALYNLVASSGSAAFVPATPLTAAPNDWTIGITYTDTLLASALGMAVDNYDNVYVSGSTNANLIEFSPQGNVLSPGIVSPATQGGWTPTIKTSKDNLRYIAFDPGGNVWLADGGSTNLYEYTPGGTPTSPVAGTLSSQSYDVAPALDATANNYAVAVDGLGDVWTTSYKKSTCSNSGTTLCELVEFAKGSTPAYTPYGTFSGTSVYSPGVGGARGVAFDVNTGNVWMTDIVEADVELFKTTPSATGVAAGGGTPTVLALGTGASSPTTNTYGAVAVAVDSTSRAWVVVQGGPATTATGTATSAVPAAIYPVSSAGVLGTAVTSANLISPAYLAIDGNNNLFVANTGASATTSAVLEYSPSFNSNAGSILSPQFGFSPGATEFGGVLSGGSIYQAAYVSVDRSGAVWVLSGGSGTSPSLANLVQILGVAAPVNPVLAAGQYGVKP